jgi:hypothetical protein
VVPQLRPGRALRYPDVEVWVASRPGRRAEIAQKLGAHAILPSKPKELVRDVAQRVRARALVPWNKRSWLQDGPGVVYDTIGSPETIETSLRLLITWRSKGAAPSDVTTGPVQPPAHTLAARERAERCPWFSRRSRTRAIRLSVRRVPG